MNGWIKLHRQILDWEWFKDVNTRIVFEYLLLVAHTKPTRYKNQSISQGGVVTKIATIAEANGLTENEVRTAIKHLTSTGEITTSSTNKNTLINIVNYRFFQGLGSEDSQTNHHQSTNQSQTINDLLTNNNAESLDFTDVEDPLRKKEGKNTRRKEGERERAPAPAEQVYGEFMQIRLTNEAYESLVKRFGQEQVTDYIDRIDRHLASTGTRYADHAAVIVKWICEDEQKQAAQWPTSKKNRFCNFEQRKRDYAALERMERQHVIDSLNAEKA